MSHELRTPLNAILGFTQLIDRDPATPQELRQRLAIVARSGEQLLGLVNKVLELTRSENGAATAPGGDSQVERQLDEVARGGAPEVASPPLTPGDLAGLPGPWLSGFREAVRSADGERISALLGELGAEHGEVARALKAWVEGYHHERVLALLDLAKAGFRAPRAEEP
jgi:signal transduction histidine kinase